MDTTTRWEKGEYDPVQTLKPGMQLEVDNPTAIRWIKCKIAHKYDEKVDPAKGLPVNDAYVVYINQLSQAQLRLECKNLGLPYVVTESAEALRGKLREREI